MQTPFLAPSPAPTSPWKVFYILLVTLGAVVFINRQGLFNYWQQAHQQVLSFQVEAQAIPQWLQDGEAQLDAVLEKANQRTSDLAQYLFFAPAETIEVSRSEVPQPEKTAALVNPKSNATVDPQLLAARRQTDGRFELTTNDRVLLIGDSMMQGIAPFISRALRHDYGIDSLDISRQSTGLAYPNFFDWPGTVSKTLATGDYNTMIVFLGANDTWDMILDKRFEPFGSERWQNVYASRVNEILTTAAQHQVRVIWLGVPVMGRAKINKGVPILNAAYQAETQKIGAFSRFVPTAALLTDDLEHYSKFKTLPDRGQVAVRTEDGVHFTAPGQRILAQLVLDQFVLPEKTTATKATP